MITEILKDSDCTFEINDEKKIVIIKGDITAKTLGQIINAGYKVNITGTIKG